MKYEIFTYRGDLLAKDEDGNIYALVHLPKDVAAQLDTVESKTKPNTSMEIITNLLMELHIPQHIKGFTYLQEAFCIVKENPKKADKILSNVYAEIAQKYDSTVTRVERAIRHALECAKFPPKYSFLQSAKPKEFIITCTKNF